MAATSLEIDVNGTDYQATAIESVKRRPDSYLVCGKYDVGAQGIAFDIFKGSLHAGTYSLAFQNQTSVDSNLRFFRNYSYTINNPPYVCAASLDINIELQKNYGPYPDYKELPTTLYKVWVTVGGRKLFGARRDATSLPSFSSCAVSSGCSGNSEIGGPVYYIQPGVICSGIFSCTNSFSLSGVTNSETIFSDAFPVTSVDFSLGYVFGVNDIGGAWGSFDSTTGMQSASLSFSNLVIP
jgi:hypothetical protein